MTSPRVFGLEVQHSATIVSESQLDTIETLGKSFQRISNGGARWEFPGIILDPRPQNDPLAHQLMVQLSKNPRQVYVVPAMQFYNQTNLAGFPSPKTTAALSGQEVSVAIAFTSNLTQAQADGFKQRFFTFSGHRKLYLLDSLGIAAGARAGTMTFTHPAQAQVEIGETINFIDPMVSVMFPPGSPPTMRTTPDGMWEISLDMVEFK